VLSALASEPPRAPAQGTNAPASAWYALAVLIATTLFAFVDRQILNLIAPTLQKLLQLSDLQLGALQGLGLALFASATGYPIGWLADRYGRRRVLGACVVLWSLSTGFCAFQNSFAGLFAGTAGIAVGESALSSIVFAMMPDLFPERQRNTANFIFFAVVLFAAAAGFALGGAMLAWLGRHPLYLPGVPATGSWRTALVLVALPGPLFALLLASIRMRPARARASKASAPAELEQFLPFVRSHWRAIACIYGAIAAYSLPLNSSFTWLPIAMPRIFGIESSAVGMQLGGAVAVGIFVGLILPPLGARLMPGISPLKPLHLARLFMIAALLPTALMLVAATPWQIYTATAAQYALGLGTGALMPGVIQQIAPAGLRSRLLAILGIVSGISTGLAPILVGAASGLMPGSRGIIAAITEVALPGWVIAIVSISLAQKPFLVTAAEVKREQQDLEAASAGVAMPAH
jgi:MFS family permease